LRENEDDLEISFLISETQEWTLRNINYSLRETESSFTPARVAGEIFKNSKRVLLF